jgi:hypothetical protein
MSKAVALILGIFIALGLLGAGYEISTTLHKARLASNTVTVKGFAEREVKANLAIWRVIFSATGDDLSKTTEEARTHEQAIRQFLAEKEIGEEAVKVDNIQVSDALANQYRNQDSLKGRFIVQTSMLVRTPQVEKVDAAARALSDVVAKGVIIGSSNVDYQFTALGDIKPAMLKEATQNARAAAQQFADDSGSKVGSISSANQGFFSISSRDGSAEQGDGMAGNTIDKKVRVVSTITYYLEK